MNANYNKNGYYRGYAPEIQNWRGGSNTFISKEEYLNTSTNLYNDRIEAGHKQAAEDMRNGYDDGLSRYRLRVACRLKGDNPYAIGYMNEYNAVRGNGIPLDEDLRNRHQAAVLKSRDTYKTYCQIRDIRERTKGHMVGPNGCRYKMKINGEWKDVSYEYFCQHYKENMDAAEENNQEKE